MTAAVLHSGRTQRGVPGLSRSHRASTSTSPYVASGPTAGRSLNGITPGNLLCSVAAASGKVVSFRTRSRAICASATKRRPDLTIWRKKSSGNSSASAMEPKAVRNPGAGSSARRIASCRPSETQLSRRCDPFSTVVAAYSGFSMTRNTPAATYDDSFASDASCKRKCRKALRSSTTGPLAALIVGSTSGFASNVRQSDRSCMLSARNASGSSAQKCDEKGATPRAMYWAT
mmetsp:Transcript_11285/g.35070  ORF Transcript_11285/g.35070 Transcript_11285/m.35070 type:complete len:231 (-) Transcript_11285:562-1254(-)